MQGNAKRAMELISGMPNEKELIGKDRVSAHIAMSCMRRSSGLSLFPFEVLYMRRDLANMKQSDLIPLISLLEASFAPHQQKGDATNEEVGVFNLLKGAMLRVCGDTSGAFQCLQNAAVSSTAREFKFEKHVLPYSHLEIAEIRFRAGDFKEARRLLNSAKARTDGPYEDLIRPKILIALDQVRVADGGSGATPSPPGSPSVTPPPTAGTPPATPPVSPLSRK